MPARPLTGTEFLSLAREILAGDSQLRFAAKGGSMQPAVCSGDILTVAPWKGTAMPGDILLADTASGGLQVHRVLLTRRKPGSYSVFLKGDACPAADGWFPSARILGVLVCIERNGSLTRLDSPSQHLFSLALAGWSGLGLAAARLGLHIPSRNS